MSIAMSSIIIIIGTLLIGAVALILLFVYMKSHRLRVRDPMNRSNYINDYWVLESKDKETGIIWWKSVFFQKSLKLPQPPEEALDVGKKGRKFAEVYRRSEDEYIYITDKGIDEKTLMGYDNKKVFESFKPFSPVQRQVVVQEFAKAEASRQHSWFKDNAMNITAMGVMLIIIVIGIIYWGDIAKFTLEKDQASTGLLKEAKNLLQEFNGDAKSLTNEAKSNTIVRPTESPPKK